MSNDKIQKDRLFVMVRSRQGLVFEGETGAVSAVNQVGPFDILPQHANFVTMIKGQLTLHKLDGGKEELKVDKGVLIVERNRVDVFIGVGTL